MRFYCFDNYRFIFAGGGRGWGISQTSNKLNCILITLWHCPTFNLTSFLQCVLRALAERDDILKHPSNSKTSRLELKKIFKQN